MKNEQSFIVYGIKNCDTVKKALTWLEKKGVPFTFHDYKAKGIDKATLERWISQTGWESLINKKGQTWRKLSSADQEVVTNKKAAISLMVEKSSVIKRPLIEREGKVVTLGFDPAGYEQLFD